MAKQDQLKKDYRMAFVESDIGRRILADLLTYSQYSSTSPTDAALSENAQAHFAGQRTILNRILAMSGLRLEDLLQPKQNKATKI